MDRLSLFLFAFAYHFVTSNAQWYHSHNYTDRMSNYDRTKLYNISMDLIKENRLQQRQLGLIKESYARHTSFQYGLIIGKLREKYKRMVDIYIEMLHRKTGRVKILGPGLWKNKALHYIIAMETVRGLEVEIDRMIDVLNKTPEEDREIKQNELVSVDMIEAYKKQQEKKRMALLSQNANSTTREGSPDSKITPHPPRWMTKRRSNDNNGLRHGRTVKNAIPSRNRGSSTKKKVNLEFTGQFRSEQELKEYYRDEFERKHGHQRSQKSLNQYFGFG